jgi:hypothetical protein
MAAINIAIGIMQHTECALNKSANQDGSCLDASHVQMISTYTKGNNLSEIKAETQCTDDECILSKVNMPVAVEERIKREALKTKADSLDGNYWMNNTEIDTCMSQMRKQYPGFAHTFIHMSDMKSFPPSNVHSFDYTVKPLTEINLAECIYKGVCKQPPHIKGSSDKQPIHSGLSTEGNVPLKSIGSIFNTDRSTGSGQHWFAVYISTDTKDPQNPSQPLILIEVFNSSGMDIDSKDFQKFWEEQRLQIAQKTGCRCEYRLVSTIPHQRDDTGNCGSYSLFYIYSRLNRARPEEFNVPGKKLLDETMQKFRSVMFQKK